MESIELVELDLESALVEFESTHVRIGPGFTYDFGLCLFLSSLNSISALVILGMRPAFFSILGGSHDILGGRGGTRKKIISGIDRARLARPGIGNG